MSSSNDTTPVRFGNYEVLHLPGGTPDELGRGGFGRTYRARHGFLGTEVALKVIADRLIFDEQAKARFLKEAQEHARLDHQGIARITDFGEMDGTLFYAMELCRDGDLKEYVRKKGPLPPADAMQLILQTAEALQYVHECGILHRDIKPSNLLTVLKNTRLPRVKITDFGLVKRIAHEEAHTGEQESASSWSPAFASPEQIREQTIDERTDIFSLGMTAWYLMSGNGPVEGAVKEIIDERLSDTSYEPRLPATLSGPLRRIVARMVEKDPAKRYRSCTDLIKELSTLLHGGESKDPSQTTRRAPERISARFTLAPAGKVYAGQVFRGQDNRRGLPVKVTVLGPEHPAHLIDHVRDKARRLAATHPPGLVPVLEATDFAEGVAVIEQDISGIPIASVLRREGAVPLAKIAGLLWDAATGLDAVAECGVTPAALESALLEGVSETGSVDWSAVQIRIGLQLIPPPPDWASGADLTTVPALASPLKMFAGLVYQALSARQVRSAALHSSAACPAIPALGAEGNRLLAACLAGETKTADCRRILMSILASENLPAEAVERRALERRLKMLGEALTHETRRIERTVSPAGEHQTTTLPLEAAAIKAKLDQRGEITEEAYLEALAELRTLAEQVETTAQQLPQNPPPSVNSTPLGKDQQEQTLRRIETASRLAKESSAQAWKAKIPAGIDDHDFSARQLEAHRSAKEAAALEREAHDLAKAGKLDAASAERLIEAAEAAAARAQEAAKSFAAAEEADPSVTVVHPLTPAELTQDAVVHKLVRAKEGGTSGRKHHAAAIAVCTITILAAGGGAWWLFKDKPAPKSDPPAPAIVPAPLPADPAPATVLPASISLRAFQSLYPLPATLTINGKTGVVEGNALFFQNAAAADGTFRMDSPAWQPAGRSVELEPNAFEAKLKLATQPVTLTTTPGTAIPWSAVAFSPEKPDDLPDLKDLRPVLGASPDEPGLKFSFDPDKLQPLTLPAGSYTVSWIFSSGGSPKPGGTLIVDPTKSSTLAIPAE
ncbi:MAG TPA: protein kinase [Verrucomicrobiales bacterium]|nr:protein kinase [Verrucomicrobiales bacterium]